MKQRILHKPPPAHLSFDEIFSPQFVLPYRSQSFHALTENLVAAGGAFPPVFVAILLLRTFGRGSRHSTFTPLVSHCLRSTLPSSPTPQGPPFFFVFVRSYSKQRMPPKKQQKEEKILLGRPGNNLKSGIVCICLSYSLISH